MRGLNVSIKTEQDVEKLRISGRLAAEVLAMIGEHVKPGVTTEYLDDICHDFIVNTLKVTPANIGYHGYTKTTCISPNEVVCHGIPSPNVVLKDGDIINIDVAIIKDGYFGDTSRMYYVGTVKPEAKKLVDTTYEAMVAGIHAVKQGATLGDIGYAIQTVAHREGYSVVREYCGHGIGKVYHEQPSVLHYGQPGKGMQLKVGMVFTIEPMINMGSKNVAFEKDGWTVRTKDRKCSAHFEHCIAIRPEGPQILSSFEFLEEVLGNNAI